MCDIKSSVYNRIASDIASSVRPTNVDALITVTTSPETSAQETVSTYNALTNCPNCGAPITGSKCEYCGTVFKDIQREIYSLQMDTKALASALRTQELFSEAIKAMGSYVYRGY